MNASGRQLPNPIIFRDPSRAATTCGDTLGGMSDTDERIGKRLAQLRGKTSQAALAADMANRGHKWSQATVWSVETAKRPLRLAEAVDVAAILGVKVDALLVADALGTAVEDARRKIGTAREAKETFREQGYALLHACAEVEAAVEAAQWIAEQSDAPMRARARMGMLQSEAGDVVDSSLEEVARGVQEEWDEREARFMEESERERNGVDN